MDAPSESSVKALEVTPLFAGLQASPLLSRRKILKAGATLAAGLAVARAAPATRRAKKKGGNQTLTDAFTARLGERVRRNCPVTAIEHSSSSVRVRFNDAGGKQELTADYLVLGMSPLSLSAVTVTPAWPETKAYALRNTRLGMHSRVLLQTKTPFWKGDIPSINLLTGDPFMGSVCETAEEVPGERRLLFGTGKPVQTPEQTLAAFRGFYPGKAKDTIEQVIVHQWWKEEPTCVGCEREPFRLGQLGKIWPHIIEPVGRIHFAGAAYDNHWRGVEAATRSANRAARKIDEAQPGGAGTMRVE